MTASRASSMSHINGRRPALWTVVTQGSDLDYDDANLLDRLEFAANAVHDPAAVARTLAQDGSIERTTEALVHVAQKRRSQETFLRAASLFHILVDHVLSPSGGPNAVLALANGLPLSKNSNDSTAHSLLPFIDLIAAHPDSGSMFALAIGQLLGSKLWSSVPSTGAVHIECSDYISKLALLLEHLRDDHNGHDASFGLPPVVATASDGLLVHVPSIKALAVGSQSAAVDTTTSIPSSIDPRSAVSTGIVSSARDEHLSRALAGLAKLLTRSEIRPMFCQHPSALAILASLLGREIHLQVQALYQAVFCLWLITFVSDKNEGPSSPFHCVANAMEAIAAPRILTSILREIEAEKVVRITLAALRNIMPMSETLRKETVAVGLDAVLQSLQRGTWHDPDILENLHALVTDLEDASLSMSTFDVYRHEVLSGALDWTPAHRDETFWLENVEKHENDNLEVLRCLVRLLNESTDTKVLCIACHDLAQFIKYHPRGRHIVHSLNVRARLMDLMVSGDVEVRRYALNTVQVLLISNWSLLQRAE